MSDIDCCDCDGGDSGDCDCNDCGDDCDCGECCDNCCSSIFLCGDSHNHVHTVDHNDVDACCFCCRLCCWICINSTPVNNGPVITNQPLSSVNANNVASASVQVPLTVSQPVKYTTPSAPEESDEGKKRKKQPDESDEDPPPSYDTAIAST